MDARAERARGKLSEGDGGDRARFGAACQQHRQAAGHESGLAGACRRLDQQRQIEFGERSQSARLRRRASSSHAPDPREVAEGAAEGGLFALEISRRRRRQRQCEVVPVLACVGTGQGDAAPQEIDGRADMRS